MNKKGAGTLVLTKDNVFTGVTTIEAGTLQLGIGGTEGSIAGDVVNNASLVFNRSNELVHNGRISGSGSVTQNGSGILVLNGRYSYTGPTMVRNGFLILGDSAGIAAKLSSDVFVKTGATFGGHGEVGGHVIVEDGATLSPGSSIGTFTAGKITFETGGKFFAELDGSESDLLVAREVDVQADAELEVAILSSTESAEYKIIETTAGINRIFDISNTYLYEFVQELRNGDLELWLARQRSEKRFADVFDGLGMFNPWQAAVGVDTIMDDFGNLDSLGNLGAALGGLTTDEEIVAAFVQLHGEMFASSREATAQTQRRFLRNLPTSRELRSRISCDPCTAVNSFKNTNRWATFTGDWLNRNNIGNFSGYDLRTYGVAFGMDKYVTKKAFVGAAFGYDDATLKFDDLRSRDEADVFRSMLYGGWRNGRTYADGYIGYTKNWHKTRRDIGIGDFSATARGKFDDDMLSTGLEIGRKLRFGELDFTPSIGLHYIHLDSPSVTENGANGANLHVSGGKYDSLRLPVGVRLSRDFQGRKVFWAPEVRAFYVAELADDSATVRTSFNNVRNVRFTASSGSWGRSSGVFGVGLKGQLSNRISLRVDYDHEVYEHTDMGEASVSASVNW